MAEEATPHYRNIVDVVPDEIWNKVMKDKLARQEAKKKAEQAKKAEQEQQKTKKDKPS